MCSGAIPDKKGVGPPVWCVCHLAACVRDMVDSFVYLSTLFILFSWNSCVADYS